ncbi:putative phage abortive infection protein [Pseudomonas sp. ok266]|uniref:putative phage abortive infection protein n=1 Tax=Pseudomonas sp. ok266 TaxID=1761896 RepID=UPI0008CC7849|nr:putative phage abortive infection protein [Pseudomonas sp. ok266]SEO98786.1 Putative phage abortive infection protein [Pseudomonas sp. ok266]
MMASCHFIPGLYMRKIISEFQHNYYYSRIAGRGFLLKLLLVKLDNFLTFMIPIMIAVMAIASIGGVAGAVYLHFISGEDIPFVALQRTETAAYWGQIGDFVGGILNPLLSFTALIAVLYSLRAQNKELALARADAKENQRIQAQQSLIFERQNFESVFFRLLDIHSRLVNEMTVEVSRVDNIGRPINDIYVGLRAFVFIEQNYFPIGHSSSRPKNYVEKILVRSKTVSTQYQNSLSHYFRNLYQLLKQVDSFGLDPLRMSRPGSRANMRVWLDNYNSQRNYSNMLRAQLSSAELSLIFMNCLTDRGEGLKFYVERFSLLKHMDRKLFGEHSSVALELFDELAFADSESIDRNKLIRNLRSRK